MSSILLLLRVLLLLHATLLCHSRSPHYFRGRITSHLKQDQDQQQQSPEEQSSSSSSSSSRRMRYKNATSETEAYSSEAATKSEMLLSIRRRQTQQAMATAPRVVNGSPVQNSKSKYPWMAYLHIEQQEGSGNTQFCGGSLVAPNVILTAAHCVIDATNIYVFLGVYDLWDENEEDIEVFHVDVEHGAVVHPLYTGENNFEFDYAVLRLDGESMYDTIQLDDGSNATLLPLEGSDDDDVEVGVELYLMGWGETKTDHMSSVLMETAVDYIPNEDCHHLWIDPITENIICTYRQNTAGCFGDSGGPLITSDGIEVGIVSFTNNECSKGGYARVSTQYNWIMDHVCAWSPCFCKYNDSGMYDSKTNKCDEMASTPSPTSFEETFECVNVPGWLDTDGFGCDWYNESPTGCVLYGDCCWNNGHTAKTACCSCGGGVVTPHAAPSSSPSNSCSDNLPMSSIMLPNEFICSNNLRYRFGLDENANLSLLDGAQLVWSVNTCCHGEGTSLILEQSGNLVIYSSVGVLWESGIDISTNSNFTGHEFKSLKIDDEGQVFLLSDSGSHAWSIQENEYRNYLLSTETLHLGEFIYSSNGHFRFGLKSDATLVLLDGDQSHSIFTSTATCCEGGDIYLRIESDGNLALHNGTNGILWSTNTTSRLKGAFLMLKNNGEVALIDKDSFTAISIIAGVGSTSLFGKVMTGYRGWFSAVGDGGLNAWQHWSPNRTPDKDVVSVDMWPDLREYSEEELFLTNFTYKNGTRTGLYSAYNNKTIDRHCRWMKEYGIDGVFVQSSVIANATTSIRRKHRDGVLDNIKHSSERHGVYFAVTFDVTHANPEFVYSDIISDWIYLVDSRNVTESSHYLHHDGRPVVKLWGFGFNNHPGDPIKVSSLIHWFQTLADERYRATIIGGVPTYWRTLERDSKSDPAWATVYRSFDFISPWTVGKVANDVDIENYAKKTVVGDMEECSSAGIEYLPVVFPGFSNYNRSGGKKAFDEIPRLGGAFFSKQIDSVIKELKNTMLFIAMFDDVDEATAIFKVAENDEQTPTSGIFLTLDEENEHVPSDRYLSLSRDAATLLQGDPKELEEQVGSQEYQSGSHPSSYPSLARTVVPSTLPTADSKVLSTRPSLRPSIDVSVFPTITPSGYLRSEPPIDMGETSNDFSPVISRAGGVSSESAPTKSLRGTLIFSSGLGLLLSFTVFI